MRYIITLLIFFNAIHSFALNYCVPAPSNGVNKYTAGLIDLESLSASSDTTNPFTFYPDTINSFTCFLHQGANYNISITANTVHSANFYAAWIDWNNDTTLSASEKLGEISIASGQTDNISFTVPVTAIRGKLRLRIRCTSSSGINSCANYTDGKTTDFNITILDSDINYNFGTGWESTGCGANYIKKITLGSISNSFAGANGGPLYNDLSRQFTPMNNCTPVNLTLVTVAPGSVNNRCDVLVDLNYDGAFTQNELLLSVNQSTGTDTTVTPLIVPSVSGYHLLRIYFYTDTGLSHVVEYTIQLASTGITAQPDAFIGSSLYSDCSGSCFYIGCAGPNTFYDMSCGTPTNWQWSVPGATPAQSSFQNPTFTFSPGVYTVTLISSNALGSDTATTTIRIKSPFLNFTLGNDTSMCTGDTITLIAPSLPGCTLYEWSDGSTGNHLTVTAPGTYSLRVDTCTHLACAKSDSISVVFSPVSYAVNGGGFYCTGGSPSPVGLSDSQSGVSYQLLRNGVNAGAPVSGTGSAISFGLQIQNGTYTVLATNTTTGCTNTMIGSVQVMLNSPPQTFQVIGGGTFCGGIGAPVSLSGSESNVDYQLYRNWIAAGIPITGSGGMINFPPQFNTGIFTVIATDNNTTCSDTMTDSISVIHLAGAQPHTVSGGGNVCSGISTAMVRIGSSDSGAVYILIRDSLPTGDTIIGNGGPVIFPNLTVSGEYTIIGYLDTACITPMNGAVTLTLKPSPAIFSVTGGGTYCVGGNAVDIGISSSEVLVNYRLWTGGFPTGGVVPGSGSALTVATLIAPGTYNVVATNTSNGCSISMTGLATIIVDSFPEVFNVTGGGVFCQGDSGVAVGLDNSDAGVTYTLLQTGDTTGLSVPGISGALSFGLIDSTGIYIVVATTAHYCSLNMSGSATVIKNPVPVCMITTLSFDTVCIFQSPFRLSGIPPGGMFSGNGISNDTLYPQLAGSGMEYITYDYTDSAGCTSSAHDSVYVDMCIGIDENSFEKNFNVYPVPASDKLRIDVMSIQQNNLRVEILNTLGEVQISKSIECCNSESLIVDVSQLSDGLHLMRIFSGNIVYGKQLIVIH
jgi:hypothetical protein